MGPLAGVKLIELAGIGPGPMCAMVLSDLGATVLRIERKVKVELGGARPLKFDLLLRGRRSIALDLKSPAAVELVLDLVEQADGLMEGFRPGVTERLGLGPDDCWTRNPRLVYGRITGWGQDGPLADAAAHDLNYIAVTGALHAIGRKGLPPSPPLRLGDYGGGAMYLALGMLAAIIEARKSGKGQVVDAAIVDGMASMLTALSGQVAGGRFSLERGTNVLDCGAHYYECYECADGRWVSVAAIDDEPYDRLLNTLGLDPRELGDRTDRSNWDHARSVMARVFKSRTREAWCEILEGTNTCFAPVLNLAEAPQHSHLRARRTFVDIDGITQPAPAPRFSRTQPQTPISPQLPDPLSALAEWKNAAEIQNLRHLGII